MRTVVIVWITSMLIMLTTRPGDVIMNSVMEGVLLVSKDRTYANSTSFVGCLGIISYVKFFTL